MFASAELVAYQAPGLAILRQLPNHSINSGEVMAIRDAVATRLVLVLDAIGRDHGVLFRAMQADVPVPLSILQEVQRLPYDSALRLPSAQDDNIQCELFDRRASLVGVVAPDTTISNLFFEVVRDQDLEEGKIVEVEILGW